MNFFRRNKIQIEPLTIYDVDEVIELFATAYKNENLLTEIEYKKQSIVRSRLRFLIPKLISFENELNK